MEQNRQIVGLGISLVFHAACVCSVLYMSSALSHFKPPLTIDFSIEKSVGDSSAPGTVAETALKEDAPPPVLKQVAPVPFHNGEPEPRKAVAAVAPEQDIAEVEIEEQVLAAVQPVQAVEPVVIKKDVAPPVPEKVIVKKEVVISPETAKIPDPAPVIKVVPARSEKKRKVTRKSPSPQAIVSETAAIAEPDPAPAVKSGSAAGSPVVSKSPPKKKERYLKENFLYIAECIQSKIVYPRIARKMGWQGRVLISFTICEDGSVKDIKIVESSGFKALDKNAVKVIQEVAPFPKPPVPAEIIIPVIYKLS